MIAYITAILRTAFHQSVLVRDQAGFLPKLCGKHLLHVGLAEKIGYLRLRR
ncbi:MAG TPA: hypothetical protein VGM27_33845 [Acidobacteriaceae bacterium]